MKYIDFFKWCEESGYEYTKSTYGVEVLDRKNQLIAHIRPTRCVLDMNFPNTAFLPEQKRKVLFDKCLELADTPLADR